MAHTEKRDYLCNYDDDDDFESPAPFPNGDVDSQGSIHCQCVNTCVRHDSQRIFSYRVELDEEDEHYGVDSRHTDWFLSQCANCKLVKICQCVVTRVEADLFVSMTSGVSFDEFMRVLKNNAQNQPDAEARATATLHSLYFGHPFPANFVPPTVWQGRDLAVANEKRMVVFELLGTQEQRQRFSDWIRDVYFAEPSGLRPGYAVSAAHSPKNSFGYHYGTAAAVEAVVVGSWNVHATEPYIAIVHIDVVVGKPGRGRSLIQSLIADCSAKSNLSDLFLQCAHVEITLESVPARFWTYARLDFELLDDVTLVALDTNISEFEDPTTMSPADFNALSSQEKAAYQKLYAVQPLGGDQLHRFRMRKQCFHE